MGARQTGTADGAPQPLGTASDGRGRGSHLLAVVLTAIAVFGYGLRLLRFLDVRLWTDEVFSAALARSPALDVIVASVRYDVHPPLYYLQLHLWQLVSDTDLWLLLNSLTWSCLAGLSIFVVLRRLFGSVTALFGLAVFAVLPLQIVFAEMLRMYSLVAVASIWQFYAVERLARSGRPTVGHLAMLAICCTIVSSSHGFGFVFNGFMLGYAGWRAWQERTWPSLWRSLLAITVLVGLLALYSLVIGSLRQTIGVGADDPSLLGISFTLTILGFEAPAPAVLGLLLVGPFLVLAAAIPASRWVTLWLFVGPTLFMMLVSITVKPVYTFRSAGLFTPFLAIGLALMLTRLVEARRPAGRVAVVALFALFATMSANTALNYRKTDFAAVSTYLMNNVSPGDVIFLDNFTSDFWGILRYLPRPVRLDSALDVQPPPSARLEQAAARLGPAWTTRLKLTGIQRSVEYDGHTVYPWFDAGLAGDLRRYWVARSSGSGCGHPDFISVQAQQIEGISLDECVRR